MKLHRIITVEGAFQQSRFIRIVATISYSLFAASGTLFLMSRLLTPHYGAVAEYMAWFMVIGGAMSAIGTGSRRWAGEFIGLPLLSAAMAVLGALYWWQTEDRTPYLALGNALMLLAIAGVMMSRWRMVHAIYRFVQAEASGEK